jgi:hypothetical protein
MHRRNEPRATRPEHVHPEDGDDRVAWAIAAFSGKTFAMELFDVCAALERIEADLPPRPTVLWGFRSEESSPFLSREADTSGS